MANVLTITDTRNMNESQIRSKLGGYAKVLEDHGMDHVSACELLSSVMNLGIAAHEQWHNKTTK